MSVRRKMVNGLLESQEIFVGLEDSKKTWKICIRSDKRIVHQTHMPAQYEVLRSFFERTFPNCKIHVVYEAGFRGFNLYDDLVSDGYDCIVVPPHTVHQEKCLRVKNDTIDARLLAKNLEDGNCKSCYVPDKERRHDREIVRTLNAVDKELKRVKNRIRKKLDFHNIKTEITATAWHNGHYRHIQGLIPSMPEPLQFIYKMLFEQFDLYLAQQKELRLRLLALGKKERYARAFEIAKSLPGIGGLTAIRLILELGEDFRRFGSGSEIASFVGLGGTEYSTGESVKRGGITKQGSRTIRSWLIQNAWVAIRYDTALQKFYTQVRRNTGQSQKAIVAVARKLITRLRCCIVNDTEYVFGVAQ